MKGINNNSAALIISVTALVFCLILVVCSMLPSHHCCTVSPLTYIALIATLMGISATFIVGVQIYHSIESNRRITEIEEKIKEKNEEIQSLEQFLINISSMLSVYDKSRNNMTILMGFQALYYACVFKETNNINDQLEIFSQLINNASISDYKDIAGKMLSILENLEPPQGTRALKDYNTIIEKLKSAVS